MESKQQRVRKDYASYPSYTKIDGLPRGLWSLRRVDHPAIQLAYVDRNRETAVNRVKNSRKSLKHELTQQDSIVFLNDSKASCSSQNYLSKHNEQIQHYFSCIKKLEYPELDKKTQDDILKLIPKANDGEMEQIMSAFTTLCKTKKNVFSYAIKQDDKENAEPVASSSKPLADESKRGAKRKDPPSNENDERKSKKQKKEHTLPVTFQNLRRVEDPAIVVVYIEGDQSMVTDRFVEVKAILGLKLSRQKPILFLNDIETPCTRDNYLTTHQKRVSNFFNALVERCSEFKNYTPESLLSSIPFVSPTELKKVQGAFAKIAKRMPEIFPSLLVAPQVVQAEEKPLAVDQSIEDDFLSTDSTLFADDLGSDEASSFVIDTSGSSSDVDSVFSDSSSTDDDKTDHTKYSAWGNPHSFFLGELRHSIPKLPSDAEFEENDSQNKFKF